MARNILKDSIVYNTIWLFGLICRILPKKVVIFLAKGLGLLLYYILKKRREIALQNLKIAFKDTIDKNERLKICKECFINLSKTVVEFMRFPKLNDKNIWEYVTVIGKEHLTTAMESGNGTIVFLPHFGNWELLSLVYGALIPNQAKAIAFPLKNKPLNDLIWRYRQLFSLELILRENAVKESLRALRNNQAVGFFADQNAGEHGVFIDFLGKPASTARGPVTLALKTESPILFSLDIRKPDGSHEVEILPPIYTETSGDLEADVRHYTSLLLNQLEYYIRKYPDQWLWIHNRWKTQPEYI
ncbi:lysophospholipid acyltransferase family protein [Candidatus Poribacteria bacterium]|nr:lysophospholipid acyltransferase family protein [Candidatus Poribacteria bacterium]